jgi:exodeoxyribonuclease VII large subunit
LSANGHSYFRLKDSESQIPAVMWRQTMGRLAFEPEDGLSVLVIASIRVYRKAGYYQLDIHRMEPRGRGALAVAFEQLRKRLEAEGLFDPAHKIPLPASIRRLGVVTSKRGAALRDIVRVTASRSPQTDIVVVDVPVQGDAAAPKIAAAIRGLNARGGVDCMIVGRGGGSAEDLWPFNEEIVARAIYESEIAVISAVGHEIDYTIADFVADVRAATPSAAAEIASPDRAESRRYLDSCARRFSGAIGGYLAKARGRLETALSSRSLRVPLDMLLEHRQTCDHYAGRCAAALGETLRTSSLRLSSASARLNALSPLAVLSRGYSVVTDGNGKAVRNSQDLSIGQKVGMRFSKGAAKAEVREILTK